MDFRRVIGSRQGQNLLFRNLFHTLNTCGDGCLAFQGRNRLEEGSCGVLTGGYGYVRVPEGGDLRADQGVCVGAYWLEGVFPLHLANKAQVRAGCGAKL